MGRQVAVDAVEHGASVVIVGRSKGRVDDTVGALTDRGGQAWGITAELTDRTAVTDVQRALSEHHSDATLLVNTAGFFIPQTVSGTTPSSTTRTWNSTMRCSSSPRLSCGHIAKGEGGSIVNIGSMWAHQAIGLTPSSGYSMQKAGLHALTHNLAIELAEHRSGSTQLRRPS